MSVRTPDHDPYSDEPDRDANALGDVFGDSRRGIAPGSHSWLTDLELSEVRRKIPMLYVEALPVRVDSLGVVTQVGILLRANRVGEITRTLVSGRVLHGETIRDALLRHLEKDLGPMAFPLIPTSITPFTVAEYFPIPWGTHFSDDRQHAVSLVYVVPVTGTCEPRQDALEVTWFTPEEAASVALNDEMEGGRGTLVRQGLASVGALL